MLAGDTYRHFILTNAVGWLHLSQGPRSRSRRMLSSEIMRIAGLLLFFVFIASSHITWIEKQPMPHGRAGGAAGLLGDHLVLAGGTVWDSGKKTWLDSMLIYDIRAGRWQEGPPLPYAMAYGPYTATQDELEVFGGTDGTRHYRECWAFEVKTHHWKQTGILPDDRLFAAAANIVGDSHLLGGCRDWNDLTQCTDSVIRRREGKWNRVSSLPHGAVIAEAVAACRGHIFIFGGCWMSQPGKLLTSSQAYSFDAAALKWRRLRDLPKSNRGASAVSVGDRYIYLIGGYSTSEERAAAEPVRSGFSRSVLIYDVETDTYQNSTPLPVGLYGTDFFLHGDTIYGAGGEDGPRGRSARLLAGRIASPR